MSRKVMSEEERRRRRNEASRRCYLKRKEAAEHAKPAAAKNKPAPKAGVPKQVAKPKPAKAPDYQAVAEKFVKKFARTAAGIKPMLRGAAEILADAYKAADEKTVLKVERVLRKGLGLAIAASDDQAKTQVGVEAWSKAVKSPAFRTVKDDPDQLLLPFDGPADEEPAGEPVEIPADPALLEKIEAGEADKSELEPAENFDEDDEGEDDEDGDDGEFSDDNPENENEDDEDEDDEDDDSEEAQARREARRRRYDEDNARDWDDGRWDMMREMGSQGVFDD